MRNSFQKLTRIFLVVLLVSACQEEITPVIGPEEPVINTPIENPNRIAGAFLEDFEGATKDFYSERSVQFSSGDWLLADAVVGYSASDRKYNQSAVRIANTGKLSMQYDITEGAAEISVVHATYGSDEPSTWQLWMSTDGSATYQQLGETISSTTTLAVATFTLTQPGNVRLEIRKVSGGANRINIDDIEVVPFSIEPEEPEEPQEPGEPNEPGEDNSHMLLGNPSGATANVSDENNYLMDKTHYVLSYNRSKATANWVSWHIDASSFGSGKRQDDFRADPALPAGWYRVGSTSYRNSGFDRGHFCPSGDRLASNAVNSFTFFMTNMLPQSPRNNQVTWNNFEEYTRKLVQQGNEVYVIMGVYGVGGTGSNGYAEKIDNGSITVPKRVWKVVVVIPQGNNDLSRISASTRVIAIDTPNDNNAINSNSAWSSYRVSVDEIEAATGYNLLSELPDAIEAALESKVDNGPVN